MGDRRIAAVLVIVTALLVGAAAQQTGFTRDEGYYFKAGEHAAAWVRAVVTSPSEALSAAGINAHLSYNPEHPFLLKGLFGLSLAINDAVGGPLSGHNALRLPAWLIAGCAVALTFALGRAAGLSKSTSVIAALLFVSLPHVWFHMRLACFDIGVTAAHTGLVAAYLAWRGSARGAVLVGVVFGIAAATKHNVLPVPALFVLHWALCELKHLRGRARIPVAFISMAVVGPVVYVALWPYLWPDIGVRFSSYVMFHVQHVHYPIMHFGELLSAPPFPWTFPLVMWALTIPVGVIIAMIAGVAFAVTVSARSVRAAWQRTIEPDTTQVPMTHGAPLLLVINALYPVVLIALPSSPIFGGTKHWMNALPFLCVLAAWALHELVTRAQFHRRVVVVVGLCAVVPGALISWRVAPYGLSAYNEVAGFSRGAANLGMQRTFWGYEMREALPLINERTPHNARIHSGDVNADSITRYVKDGMLRRDITYLPTVRGAGVAHVEPQGEFKQQQLDVWNEWRARSPDRVIAIEGVPLSTVTFRE